MTANGLDSFAHAAQAIALAANCLLPIVLHDEAAMTGVRDKAEAAVGGASMAHDVGDGFSQAREPAQSPPAD